ncbi:hypothetical protein JCM19239_4447 [Vibrio variabilis]|uniref:Uncharacterized protein n=1 Tax=Vibrio variabilis TaxID=990271 RepID=A0ABQ0JHP9_9VIBR|nr:hypothetical protein JCM19239_4447 [Vibrio variabilis]
MLKNLVSPTRTIDSKALIIAAMMLVMFAPTRLTFYPLCSVAPLKPWH